MAHFAKVLNGIVVQVIVAEPEFFDSFVDATAGEWIQTSYNTFGGVHILGGTPLRKNFAAVGYSYDYEKDAFIAPKPYPSWTLNEESYLWEPPTPRPIGIEVLWDEQSMSWIESPTES